ncbi:MAG: hypothetical protein R3B09_15680 [Nannocystaceae bacterium]
MAFTKLLISGLQLRAGEEKRLLPGLPVAEYDRLHLHIGGRARTIDGLTARVLFSTSIPGGAILSDRTVWYGESTVDHDFQHTATVGHTGFIMSVPVVAPTLYDVVLKNTSAKELVDIYVTLLAK